MSERLSEDQLVVLQPYGELRHTWTGQVLFRQGDSAPGLVVVLEGLVEVTTHDSTGQREVSVQGRGGFVGLVAAVTGERAYVTAVAREAGKVLIVPVAELRELVATEEAFGDTVLQMLFRRRQWLTDAGAGVRIVGSRYSRDTHRLREFASRNRLAHQWIELEPHPEAELYLTNLGIEPQETPVVLLGAGEVLRNPTNAELARAVGLRGANPVDPAAIFDVVVVGAGPAGLAAAVYGASNGLSTAVIDAVAAGGQAGTATRIENYLGFPSGVSGGQLAERALMQAEKFGARFVIPARANALLEDSGYNVLRLDDQRAFYARSVIVACGVEYRRLDVPGIQDYEGIGVAYTVAATMEGLEADGAVVIVGGANSAGQAALSLAANGHHAYLVVRGGDLAKDMARYLIDRIQREPSVEVLYRSELRQVGGADALENVVVEDVRTRMRRTLEARALCVLIGAEPRTEWLADALTLDEDGFAVTGPALGANLRETEPWLSEGRDPYLLETNRPSVFAAGDVRSGSVKRVATAAGEGSMAVRFAQECLLSEGSATLIH